MWRMADGVSQVLGSRPGVFICEFKKDTSKQFLDHHQESSIFALACHVALPLFIFFQIESI